MGRAEHLELFFNLSLDMMCVCSSEGWFVRVNPAFTRILGYTEEELLSRPYREFVHPEDRDSTVNVTTEIADGKRVEHFENRYLCKDGSWRWISWTATAAAAVDGLFYAVARDVSAQKKETAAREELLEHLQATLNQIKTLEGLLPICSWCHHIRDEEGKWGKVENYIARHTEAEFTHAICPDCLERNFPRA